MEILAENNSITELFTNVENVKYTNAIQQVCSTARDKSAPGFVTHDDVWDHCERIGLAEDSKGIAPQQYPREVYFFNDECPLAACPTHAIHYITFVSKLQGEYTQQCIVTTQEVRLLNSDGRTVTHLKKGELSIWQKPVRTDNETYSKR